MSASAAKPVEFDLPRGQVHFRGGSQRLLLPVDAIQHLCEAAGESAQRAFGRALGNGIGMSVTSRPMGGDGSGQGAVRSASPAAFVDALGGELALMGLGSLSLERWGRALVIVLDGCPLRGCEAALGELLQSALEAATGADVELVHLGAPGGESSGPLRRYAACGEAGAKQLREWLAGGVPWGEALVRLHTPAAAPRGGA